MDWQTPRKKSSIKIRMILSLGPKTIHMVLINFVAH